MSASGSTLVSHSSARGRSTWAAAAIRGAQLAAALLLLALAALAALNPRAAISHAYGYRTDGHGGMAFEYAVLDPRTDSQVSSTDRSWRSLSELGQRYHRTILWFSISGDDYVVSDPRLVQRAEALVAPVLAMGHGQAALAEAQAGLARASASLGRAEVERRQRDLERRRHDMDRQQRQAADRAATELERLAKDSIAAGKAEAQE